jgi:osmoprotectant transport system substrate-binding protein
MSGPHLRRAALLAGSAGVLVLTACSSSSGASPASSGSVSSGSVAEVSSAVVDQVSSDAEVTGPITVGSLEFGSSRVMAELYVRALREAGFAAQLTVPSTNPVLVQAMEAGAVDVLPGYVGPLSDYLYIADNGEDAVRPATTDLATTLAAGNALAAPRGLELLDATPAAETAAFAVSKDFAEATGVTTLSRLAEWSKANPLRMGGEKLCEVRPYCLPNLVDTYGVVVKEYVPLSADGTIVRSSLVDGGIEVGYLSGTDSETSNPDLVVLAQDKPLNIVGNIAPLVRRDIATPEVVVALNEVSAKVTDEALGAMVEAVQSDGQPIARVTGDFVAAQGIGEGLYTGPTKVVSASVPQEVPVAPTIAPAGGPVRISYAPLVDTEIAAQIYARALVNAGIDVQVGDPQEPSELIASLPGGTVQFAPMRLNTLVNLLNTQANGALAAPIEGRNVNKMIATARDLGGPRGMTILKNSTATVSSAWSVNNNFVANTGITTLSELARVSQNRPIIVAGPPTCADEVWCKPFLEDKYGIKIAQFVPLDYGGALSRGAIDSGAVDVAWLDGNDGGIEEFGFKVLTDDLGRESVNPITPVLNAASVTPEIAKVLDEVSTVLTTDDLKAMNYAVEFERRSMVEVVDEFLRDKGLA